MRSHRLWRALSERRGEGYVDVIVLVLCAVMVLALAMRVLPVFIQKQQLDTFATELVREAEVSGRRCRDKPPCRCAVGKNRASSGHFMVQSWKNPVK